MQQFLKRRDDPHTHGSSRPSFSRSSLSPRTTRSPRLTPVSDGKPLRRLLVRCVVKADVVFEFGFHDRSPHGLLDDMR